MVTKPQMIINEVKKVIVGKDEILEKVFMSILAEGHMLLEDIPGVGKTTLALAFSKTMGLYFNRIQCTQYLGALDIVRMTIHDNRN